MKTITFKLPFIVLALCFSFSHSSSAQYNTTEHFSHGADMAEIYINNQWNVHPYDVTPDGTVHSNDNARTITTYNQGLDKTLTGESATLLVKNRYIIIPNPSSGKTKLEVQLRPKDSQLLLFDLTGRQQIKICIDPGQDNAEIDVVSLSKGIYILKVMAGEAVVGVEKIVIN